MIFLKFIGNIYVLTFKLIKLKSLNSNVCIHIGIFNSIHFSRFILKLTSLDDDNHVITQSTLHSIPNQDLLNLSLDKKSKVFLVFNKYFFFDFLYYTYRIECGKIPLFIKIIARMRRSSILDLNNHTKKVLMQFFNRDCSIFAHQLQSSGYLLVSVLNQTNFLPKRLIYICYGSDINFFKSSSVDEKNIISFLNLTSHALVECVRDEKLIRFYNSKIQISPIFPNSWINLDNIFSYHKDSYAKQRKDIIVVKAYSDFLGRSQNILDVIFQLKDLLSTYEIYFISANAHFREYTIIPLMNLTDLNYTIFDTLEPEQLYDLLVQSRTFISCSLSDGLGTLNLEAYLLGNVVITADSSQISTYINDEDYVLNYEHNDTVRLKALLLDSILNLKTPVQNRLKIDSVFNSLRDSETARIKWLKKLDK